MEVVDGVRLMIGRMVLHMVMVYACHQCCHCPCMHMVMVYLISVHPVAKFLVVLVHPLAKVRIFVVHLLVKFPPGLANLSMLTTRRRFLWKG